MNNYINRFQREVDSYGAAIDWYKEYREVNEKLLSVKTRIKELESLPTPPQPVTEVLDLDTMYPTPSPTPTGDWEAEAEKEYPMPTVNKRGNLLNEQRICNAARAAYIKGRQTTDREVAAKGWDACYRQLVEREKAPDRETFLSSLNEQPGKPVK